MCQGRESLPFLLPAHIDQVIRVGTMSGRDPRAVENELFMRSQAHSASSYPRQPWEQPGLLCVFSPVQAAFPARLSIPYQGPAIIPTNVVSATQSVPIALSSKSATPCEAWTRAVKAKRGVGSADKRAEAFHKILSLLNAFASFFDLAELLAEDESEGDSLKAVLAAKAPSTILKHAGPVRTFCEWLVKSNSSPPFGEKVVWTFVHCVLKMPRTAASTLDTCLKAIKWSYRSLGLRVQLDVFRSARVNGLVSQALQTKSPWDPAPPLTVAEVLQLHAIAQDPTMSLIDRCGAVHFLAMMYGRARASDVRCIQPLIIDKCGSESWRHSFIELGTLQHKTSRFDAQKRRILPLVIPGIGIAKHPFGVLLLSIREEAGLSNEAVDVPFLPAPYPDGSWSSDPLCSSEITRWLRYLIPRADSEKQLSSHSLKVTTLVWCSRFGVARDTKRVLGHHADAAAGSDAIYGRELQSAALREYVLVLGAIAEGQFFPGQTRSGHFAPGWSREAILSVAAVPPSSTTTTSNDADDQDEALAVVSDDSDSEDDDTEMPLFWAHPTSQILHRTTLGSAMFLCGRVFGDHYRRIPIARAQTYPHCSKCFPAGSFE